ncbi:DUF1631 family protein [Silvimonas amylolytica]|uniref:DUF1631 domain-containing protein n=1 Tax=Silvimonas amylolytica TaxID=449663 RepID=A0ABQ2PMG7_9NEIS|nr:DUF1631 family protein [Silvimonas amylolytica]GGP26560.1 hypothetical protein GCM10010971_23790 [Silvimonas amylolytica]
MDRNAVLAQTRKEFLKAFAEAVDGLTPVTMQRLNELADSAGTAAERFTRFDARTALFKREAEVRLQMNQKMEALLNRAFQTAYSTFRPSFADAFTQTTLSLIDTSTQDEEMRMDNIMRRYRNSAEQQLRDLNIRMAVLFGQEDIKERENPFRPYLFVRCITQTVETLHMEAETANVLTDQLAGDLTEWVVRIYETLNESLADQGIASTLQLKIRRSKPAPWQQAQQQPAPAQMPEHADSGMHEGNYVGEMPFNPAGLGMPPGMPGMPGMPGQMPGFPQGMQPPAADRSDQLLQFVQHALGMGPEPAAMQAHAAQGGSMMPGGMPQGMGAGAAGGQAPAGWPGGWGSPAAMGGEAGGGQYPAGSPWGGGAGAGAGGAGAPAPAQRRSWLSATQGVGEALRNLFTGSGRSSQAADGYAAEDHLQYHDGDTATGSAAGNMAGWDAFQHTPLSGMVEELQYAATPTVEQIVDNGRVRNLILEARSRLADVAKDSSEQMIIDTVAMLFEFILSDTEVPAEVRAQLGRLQFLVLKTALLDPEFFTQSHHPARMLVNRIGSISLGLRSLDPSGERISVEIRQIIETLLADKTEGLALFGAMLDEFDAFIARELRNANTAVGKAVEAIETAENHTVEYARITGMLGDALGTYRLDGFLQEFLVNDWTHAIERVSRVDPDRALSYRLLVPDLIWSIAPKVTPSERKELLGMIPGILATLRSGLEETGLARAEQQKVLAWLAESHRLALSANHVPAPVPPVEMVRENFMSFLTAEPPEETAATQAPVFDRHMVTEAINELDVELDLIDHMLETEDKPLPPAPAEVQTTATAEEIAQDKAIEQGLQGGVTVEVNLDGHPSRARLNWVSTTATTLVLTIEGNDKPSVVSVKMFKRLLAAGRARFLETTPLFERAINALLTSADKLDSAPGNHPFSGSQATV